MFSGNTSTILMAGGIALAAFLLLRNSGGFFSRSRRKEDGPKELRKLFGERSRDSALGDAPPEVLRWQVEMHETARDLKAELDSKLAALQALVLIARQEREKLEEAIRRVHPLPNSQSAKNFEQDAPRSALEAIEGLADPAALADPQAMARVVAQFPAKAPSRAGF